MKRSQRIKAILLGLFLAAVLVLASCTPMAMEESGAPKAWIGGPPDGSEVTLGEVEVMCHAFAGMGISQVELWVNGAFASRFTNTMDPGATYLTEVLSFQATAPGTYVLHCRTIDQEATTGQSDPVTVRVTGEAPGPPPPPPPPTPVDTATPTATGVPPTAHPVPPTATRVPPTATRVPPTATRVPPTRTPLPPSPTPTTPPPPPTIRSFEADPPTVMSGAPCPNVILSWDVTGIIDQVRLGGPSGEGVGHDDSRPKCPSQTTSYLLWAKGPGGETTAELTVFVIQASPTLDDRTGPSITSVYPLRGLICTGNYCAPADRSLEIGATVTDLSGVRSVELYCTYINGGTQPEQYCGALAPSGGNNWVIDYTPPGWFYAGSIDYRIKATDDSPRQNVSWWGTVRISVQPGIG